MIPNHTKYILKHLNLVSPASQTDNPPRGPGGRSSQERGTPASSDGPGGSWWRAPRVRCPDGHFSPASPVAQRELPRAQGRAHVHHAAQQIRPTGWCGGQAEAVGQDARGEEGDAQRYQLYEHGARAVAQRRSSVSRSA